MRVLVARPSGAEARLSFAALIDLFDGGRARERWRGCRRRSVRRWRWRCCGPSRRRVPPEPHAIALGLLQRAARAGRRGPVLVAIDDVQWLDAPSADALAFAARRLRGRAGRVPARQARRSAPRARAGARAAGLGAPRGRAAESRRDAPPAGRRGSGLSLPRQLLRRIVESTLGNPLFALEVGRALVEHGHACDRRGHPGAGRGARSMLGTRVARLPAAVRRLLLAVALSGDLRDGELLRRSQDPARWRTRSTPGCWCVDGDRVRASHPLLAAAAKKRSRRRERRELHLALAEAVADDELRALHLALATDAPGRRARGDGRRRGGARVRARRRRRGGGAGRARAAADAAGRRRSAPSACSPSPATWRRRASCSG